MVSYINRSWEVINHSKFDLFSKLIFRFTYYKFYISFW